MALVNSVWYTYFAGYFAVPTRPRNAPVAAGVLRRQSTIFTDPLDMRVFICVVGGTT